MGRFDMFGAVGPSESKGVRVSVGLGDSWTSAVATLAGGVIGTIVGLRIGHPVLGFLDGMALVGNATRVVTKEISLRRGAENLGAHAVATASSLALGSKGSWAYAMFGYLAGAAGSNLFLRRVEPRERSTEVGADDFVGPLSSEQLSKLDRALTPAEQRDVDRWQAEQAKAAQKAEEAKGGPRASLSADARGAVVTARSAPLKRLEIVEKGRPVWEYVLAAIGILVAGGALIAGLVGGGRAKALAVVK